MLGALDECDLRVREEAHQVLQEVGLDDVVGVDDADDLDLLGQPARGFVERPGLEPRPVLEMHELEALAQLGA